MVEADKYAPIPGTDLPEFQTLIGELSILVSRREICIDLNDGHYTSREPTTKEEKKEPGRLNTFPSVTDALLERVDPGARSAYSGGPL